MFPRNYFIVLSAQEKYSPENHSEHSHIPPRVKPDAQIGPLKREVPGPAGRSLGPLFSGAQSQLEKKKEGNEESKASKKGEKDIPSTTDIPGKDIKEFKSDLSLVGSDVIALFPSITAEKTGKIVRQEIENSEVEFEGFDVDKGRAYIVINRDMIDDIEEIEYLLPARKGKTGIKPTMSSITTRWNPEEQWVFPPNEP